MQSNGGVLTLSVKIISKHLQSLQERLLVFCEIPGAKIKRLIEGFFRGCYLKANAFTSNRYRGWLSIHETLDVFYGSSQVLSELVHFFSLSRTTRCF